MKKSLLIGMLTSVLISGCSELPSTTNTKNYDQVPVEVIHLQEPVTKTECHIHYGREHCHTFYHEHKYLEGDYNI